MHNEHDDYLTSQMFGEEVKPIAVAINNFVLDRLPNTLPSPQQMLAVLLALEAVKTALKQEFEANGFYFTTITQGETNDDRLN